MRTVGIGIVFAAGSWYSGVGSYPPQADWPVRFTDVAQQVGLMQPTVYGDLDRKRFIIETNRRGHRVRGLRPRWVARRADSQRNTARERQPSRDRVAARPGARSRLYRNRRGGTFQDVTASVGLERIGWASSVCAGDYNDDGWVDLYVTYFGQNALYTNERSQRFRESTVDARLASSGSRWGSAVFSITTGTATRICSSPTI